MDRAAVAVVAFVAGAAVVLLALYGALQSAPGMILADDEVEALTAVADESLGRFPTGSTVYIKSSVGPALLERLQPRHPALRLMSFSARPTDTDCAVGQGPPQADRCERDDFLKLEVLSSPTPRSMLIAFGTSSTFGQVLLVKPWGSWRVLVFRSHRV